jgi:predicted dehydrogenase
MAATGALRLGIVSTANINAQLLGGAAETDAVEVVAVGSRDGAKGRAFADRYGILTVRDSYEALLADPGVEAVYIPLPNSLHHPWTMAALRAGKHVLVEKPYSADPADVEAAFDLAEQNGLVVAEAFMWRHGPGARLIGELLPQVGDVLTIRTSFSFALTWETDVRLDSALAGGSLMDVGCYSVSGARLAAGGDPVRVFGSAIWGPTGVDRRFHGQLEFASGSVAQIMCGFDTNARGIEVIGTEGWFQLPDPWRGELGRTAMVNGEPREYAAENQYRLELEDFAGAVRGTRAPLLGRNDALGQARTIAALYRSAREGAPVRL